jgi:hypothetical protein
VDARIREITLFNNNAQNDQLEAGVQPICWALQKTTALIKEIPAETFFQSLIESLVVSWTAVGHVL